MQTRLQTFLSILSNGIQTKLTCAYDRRLSRFKTEDSIPLLRYSRQYSLSY